MLSSFLIVLLLVAITSGHVSGNDTVNVTASNSQKNLSETLKVTIDLAKQMVQAIELSDLAYSDDMVPTLDSYTNSSGLDYIEAFGTFTDVSFVASDRTNKACYGVFRGTYGDMLIGWEDVDYDGDGEQTWKDWWAQFTDTFKENGGSILGADWGQNLDLSGV